MHPTPEIAVLTPDTLAGLGLKSLLEKLLPMAEVTLFDRFEALAAERPDRFFHYFVPATLFIAHGAFFQPRSARTILLVNGSCGAPLQGMHCLNVCQSEESLVRDLLRLHHSAHRGGYPGVTLPEPAPSPLSRREAEVLRLVVRGLLNKQIADRLGIRLTTVITHRQRIGAKLGIRSVAGLTIYAVTHGYADPDAV